MLTPLLIVLTALGFGAGDFLAGLASKKASALAVSLYSQGVAMVLVAAAVVVFAGTPEPAALLWGLAAGIALGLGIVRYYHSLTRGAMGWVATVMGAFSAMVPLAAGIALGERPSLPAVAGVFLIIGALFLLLRRTKAGAGGVNGVSGRPGAGIRAGVADGILAGTWFGIAFVFLGFASGGNPLWSVLMALAGSILPLLVYCLFKASPPGNASGAWNLILATGAVQGLALMAFALAVLDGYVSIVSAAGALSPVATSVLAFAFLCERLSGAQALAIGVALAGIGCLVIG